MKRRAFLKAGSTVGGVALATLLLDACAPDAETPAALVPSATAQPSETVTTAPPATETASANPTGTVAPVDPNPTAQPSPTATEVLAPTRRPTMSKIAFVKTQDRAAGVARALALLDYSPPLGGSVFLKPNYNSSDPNPGSTHNDTLAALVRALQAGGVKSITVGDRSGMGDTRAVMERLGVFNLAEELNLETMVFDELGIDDWEIFPGEGNHWSRGFALPGPMLEADSVVQTCCLKTHRYGGHFTLSLKNSVGLAAKWLPGDDYNYMSELHGSPFQRQMIAEINAAYRPDLIVLDGVLAFVEGGPAEGKLAEAGVILAGSDRVAIDAVGVALLRYHGTTREVRRGAIFEQEQIARAVELGLGVTGPESIELLTDDANSAAYAAEIRQILLEA